MSKQSSGELGRERYYADGLDPVLLDVIRVQFLKPTALGCQSENHEVDSSYRWVREGNLTWEQITPALDEFAGPLWINGSSTSHGVNDQIPEEQAAKLPNSLALVEVKNLVLRVDTEGRDFRKPKRKVRADFSLNGERYILAVTDPIVEKEFFKKPDGAEERIQIVRLCLSISEPFKERRACYKLVAGVLVPQ